MPAPIPTTPTPEEGRIVQDSQGAVMLIGIDRPKKLNGWTPEMMNQLATAFTEYERDPALRCALIYSTGPHFTAGLDLPRCAHLFKTGKRLFAPGLVDPIGIDEPRRTKPVVVAVEGICFTLGIELLLACDVTVAARNSRFSQLEVKRGIMASAGATIRMVERAGWGNAMRYLLTGDEFDGETAYRLGFVQQLTEPGAAFDAALAIAETISRQAPLAVREMILSARRALEEGPREAAKALTAQQAFLSRTEDAAEGVRAFVERRDGKFMGR